MSERRAEGTIGWMARNGVAPNLIMALLIVFGLVTIFGLPLPGTERLSGIKQEVFPEFSLDTITISVPYLGAAPEEVEEAVCVRIEEEIQDLDGVKRIVSVAAEGFGTVNVELETGADARDVLDDIKTRVDAIDTFPEETEKPVIREITNRRQVIDLAIYGDADDRALRALAERVRDELSALPGITLVELANVRPYEIAIEISEQALRRHGLTFDAVADAVRRSSLELPGGSIRTAGGEILLRTASQAERGPEFERLPVLSRPDGSQLHLGEVATIVDGFAETDQVSRFEGKPAVLLQVFRTGDQDALSIAGTVKAYIDEAQARMPAGVELAAWNNAARVLQDRRDLLLRNGGSGLLLVALTLALFLRFRLAFWVALGMMISFLGAIALMPALDVSISLISLFAFILVLGIVVDDAIVVGENIHTHQQRHGDGMRGAIEGAREVSQPVVFAVLTTVAAFTPLLDVEGTIGKVMGVIPLIVIPCLLWSLVESLWILPNHLSHAPRRDPDRPGGPWRRLQRVFSSGLERLIERGYSPALEIALRWRYLTLAIGVGTLLVTLGLVGGGAVRFVFFPTVEADFVSAALTMPRGTPIERTESAVRQLEASAATLRAELTERYGSDQFRYISTAIGEQPFRRAQAQNAGGFQDRQSAAHLGELTIELVPAELREAGSEATAARWRELTGPVADALELTFTSSLFSAGEDVNVQLTGPDLDELRTLADRLQARLAAYDGVYEISDSFEPGKPQLELDITRRAELAGLTLSDLARQVRQAFYGEEAQRIQRGRDELRVMVRYPERERRSLADLERMRVRAPDGTEIPFSEVARVEQGRGFASITRVDRRRAVTVTASVDPSVVTAGQINGDLAATILPELLRDHPGVRFTFEGQAAEQRDTIGGLLRGFVLALVAIYALLAIPLRSYAQPLLIMAAIPFGLVGAIWGHVLMGLNLTILSMFGLVALTGVVVNDSLVMVDFINRHRQDRDRLLAAVRSAGAARFRPILLTSMTTFAGLLPLMTERSMQARFLIPMAVSLAFGVVFATVITLVLVPSGYMLLEDLRRLGRRASGRRARARSRARTAPGAGTPPADSAAASVPRR